MLTGFGAGALLAAVTVGIVAPLAATPQRVGLVAGAVAGGLAFAVLNRTVNARGGFLRKTSTALVHLQQRERRRRQLLARLERVDLFDGLPDRELDLLADAAEVRSYPRRQVIHRAGDPAETLSVIVHGDVALDHGGGVESLTPHEAFGFRSFLAGTPHGSSATADADPTDVLEVSREGFVGVLDRAPALRERLQVYLQRDDVLAYLRDTHGLTSDELADWCERVRADGGHGTVRARPAPHVGPAFATRAPTLRRLPVFADLPASELEAVGRRMVATRHREGHVFFAPGDASDRLYVLVEGSVALASGGAGRGVLRLQPGDVFGALSLFTGAPHVATAVATSDGVVWVLRRRDLAALLDALPRLRHAVHAFLERPDVGHYLQDQQGVGAPQVQAWIRRAVRSVEAARPLPTVRPASAAPGASLVTGLFLSNYPEALSSSVGMREQGTAWRRILLLWSSLVVAAAVGAGVGAVVFDGASAMASAAVRGVAAGAMLTVISETMLPEAFARSGGASGMSALTGFLTALVLGA